MPAPAPSPPPQGGEEGRRIRELEARKHALVAERAAKQQNLARVDSLLNRLSQAQIDGGVELPTAPAEREHLFELHRYLLQTIR
jgi:hypothetical protein